MDQADEQAGKEDEALRVLHEAQLGMVEVDEPEPAREREVVDEHEDEEIAPQPVEEFETAHPSFSGFFSAGRAQLVGARLRASASRRGVGRSPLRA